MGLSNPCKGFRPVAIGLTQYENIIFKRTHEADCLWQRQQRLGSQSDPHKLGIKWERCKSGADS